MNDYASVASLVIGGLFTWTLTVVSLVIWLTGKFRELEKIIYHEMDKHRTDDERQFRAIGTKVQRLEIKSFGFTGPSLEEGGLVP